MFYLGFGMMLLGLFVGGVGLGLIPGIGHRWTQAESLPLTPANTGKILRVRGRLAPLPGASPLLSPLARSACVAWRLDAFQLDHRDDDVDRTSHEIHRSEEPFLLATDAGGEAMLYPSQAHFVFIHQAPNRDAGAAALLSGGLRLCML